MLFSLAVSVAKYVFQLDRVLAYRSLGQLSLRMGLTAQAL